MEQLAHRPIRPIGSRAPASWPLSPRPADGFTLVELLVTVAIAAVLAGVGIPSWRALAEKLELIAASNGFIASLHLARSEAVKRHDRVVLCKSPDGILCTEAGGWEQGWLIFHDANNNGTREGAEQILRRQQPLPARLRLTGNSQVAHYVSFVPMGGTKLVTGGFQAGTLTLCRASAGALEGRRIILNAAGRPRVHRTSIASCV